MPFLLQSLKKITEKSVQSAGACHATRGASPAKEAQKKQVRPQCEVDIRGKVVEEKGKKYLETENSDGSYTRVGEVVDFPGKRAPRDRRAELVYSNDDLAQADANDKAGLTGALKIMARSGNQYVQSVVTFLAQLYSRPTQIEQKDSSGEDIPVLVFDDQVGVNFDQFRSPGRYEEGFTWTWGLGALFSTNQYGLSTRGQRAIHSGINFQQYSGLYDVLDASLKLKGRIGAGYQIPLLSMPRCQMVGFASAGAELSTIVWEKEEGYPYLNDEGDINEHFVNPDSTFGDSNVSAKIIGLRFGYGEPRGAFGEAPIEVPVTYEFIQDVEGNCDSRLAAGLEFHDVKWLGGCGIRLRYEHVFKDETHPFNDGEHQGTVTLEF